MKAKRMAEMSQLEKEIVLMVWKDIKDLPLYNGWRNYERGFVFENKPYRYQCKFKIEDNHLKLIDTHIEHEQKVVELMH